MQKKVDRLTEEINRLTNQYMELERQYRTPTAEMKDLRARAAGLIDQRRKLQSKLDLKRALAGVE